MPEHLARASLLGKLTPIYKCYTKVDFALLFRQKLVLLMPESFANPAHYLSYVACAVAAAAHLIA